MENYSLRGMHAAGDETPYTATLPAGTILTVKGQLGTWGKRTGKLLTYPGLYDLNDTIDESFLNAVRSFQTWANATRGLALRTDGRFDLPTHTALIAETVPTTDTTPGTGGTSTPGDVTTLPKLPPLPDATKPADTSTKGSSSSPLAKEQNRKAYGAVALASGAALGIGAIVVASKRRKGHIQRPGLTAALAALATVTVVGSVFLLTTPPKPDNTI